MKTLMKIKRSDKLERLHNTLPKENLNTATEVMQQRSLICQ